MRVNELIQRVQSLYSRGVQSDDSRLTPRHIYNKLLTARSNLLYIENQKGRRYNEWNYQTIPCVELINVSRHECSCLPELDCGILRTKYKIPKVLSIFGKPLIKSVSTVDSEIIYNKSTIQKNKYLKGNKYNKDSKSQWYIENEYIYINDINASHYIKITGIFEDPIEVKKFKSACDGDESDTTRNCISPLDEEFPIDAELLDPLILTTADELVRLFNASLEDITNDSKDNRIEQSK